MASLNKVMVIGNLTRDPEVKYTPKGTAVAQVGLAVNRQWKNEAGEKQEEVTFLDVELFGKTAELAGQYLKRGRPVFFEGRLKLDQWEDKQTGEKRSKLKIIAESMQFLGGRDDDQQTQRQTTRQATQPATRPSAQPEANIDPADDLPF